MVFVKKTKPPAVFNLLYSGLLRSIVKSMFPALGLSLFLHESIEHTVIAAGMLKPMRSKKSFRVIFVPS